MAVETKKHVQKLEAETRTIVQKATVAQLLQIASSTVVAKHPLVSNYNDPAAAPFYHKEEDLRRLFAREMKRHADFRGMVIGLVAQMGMASVSAKDESASDSDKGTSAGQPKKAKK